MEDLGFGMQFIQKHFSTTASVRHFFQSTSNERTEHLKSEKEKGNGTLPSFDFTISSNGVFSLHLEKMVLMLNPGSQQPQQRLYRDEKNCTAEWVS